MNLLLTEFLRSNDVQAPNIQKLAGQGDLAIHGFALGGRDKAIGLFEKMMNLKKETGLIPIILGCDDDLRELDRRLEFCTDDDVHEAIEKSHKFDMEEWLKTRALEVIRDEFSFNRHPDKWATFTGHPFLQIGETDRIYLGLIPCEVSWQAPAFLAFGGWNDNPPVSVHCSLLKRWNRLFGADVISITKEEISLFIQIPPRNVLSALEIREELCLYCPDSQSPGIIRDNGFFTAIVDAPYWSFWWMYPWGHEIFCRLPQAGSHKYDDKPKPNCP